MIDNQIEEKCFKKSILEVGKKLNLENNLILYGNDKAKIKFDKLNPNGKLILVTSINPTPYGEGKTTLSIGINDALNKLGKNSIVCLREPSLGPVFGIKGGATGGGYSQVIPSLDINLHFTGDIHAIESANNLICSLIDNHIYHGNELNIDPDRIQFHRCIDMNDRILRDIQLENRKEFFQITAASEIMAILCLSNSVDELKNKIDHILIGYKLDGNPLFFKEFHATNAVYLLLKDAFYPNLVQSLENNPVIIHGGPFANIAHGCNSIISTKLGLTLSDYTITEAGFGSDLGAEKFFDIKCRYGNLKPDLTIINVTIRALKHHGNQDLIKGFEHLKAHIFNMKLFQSNILVVLNKFQDDIDEEIINLKQFLKSLNIDFLISDSYSNGSSGAIDIAKYIISLNKNNNFHFLYSLEDTIENKINTICTKIYHSNPIKLGDEIKRKIDEIKKIGYDNLPICIAKTPNSFSPNPKLLNNPTNYDIEIKNIELKSGAGFIIVYLGNIVTMPGLPKKPNALQF